MICHDDLLPDRFYLDNKMSSIGRYFRNRQCKGQKGNSLKVAIKNKTHKCPLLIRESLIFQVTKV